jgi:hypothetical protein
VILPENAAEGKRHERVGQGCRTKLCDPSARWWLEEQVCVMKGQREHDGRSLQVERHGVDTRPLQRNGCRRKINTQPPGAAPSQSAGRGGGGRGRRSRSKSFHTKCNS